MWWWLVLVVPAAALETSTSKSEKLAEALRRQLMADNYDYMSDSEDRAPRTGRDQDQDQDLGTGALRQEEPAAADERGLTLFHDTKEVVANGTNTTACGPGPSRPRESADHESPAPTFPGGGPLENVTTTAVDDGAKFTFKVLKVKRSKPSRRDGGGAVYRSFLQAEDERGVALVRLDDGPFPQLRLDASSGDDDVSDPGAVLEGAAAAGQAASVEITTH